MSADIRVPLSQTKPVIYAVAAVLKSLCLVLLALAFYILAHGLRVLVIDTLGSVSRGGQQADTSSWAIKMKKEEIQRLKLDEEIRELKSRVPKEKA